MTPSQHAFAGRVAVIGWGSLIWDLDDLAPHVAGEWALGGGPALPLEFSRISPKRAMSLVVVIDPDCGAPCPTSAIASVRRDVAQAAADLGRRERARDPAHIGAWCARRGLLSGAQAAGGAVASWCGLTGAAGAVWTDLPRNFEAETGTPFTVEAGLAYLRRLGPESLAVARLYIGSAPHGTDTPLRRALAGCDWWPDPAAADADRSQGPADGGAARLSASP
ncbi:hypothetical protein [Rubrimonas cliftonensis]|uniref:Uncharacterized protein n=1 Tax=Rubrimonas cliftonensis TaxID=89524 RepID=A0A1H3ZZY0_9RHOB|nr:hypothetical protein [Rubrimonas cliftonensis]SEA29433.1 hypothetical protein SAMN05444370_10413 [Rubrimonas cliftonensis]